MGKLEQNLMQKKPLLLCNMKIERILDKKKALRMCVKKLKKISDPESKLCQAVLINNTLQSLKNFEDIKLQNGKKSVDKMMETLPTAPNQPGFSPEDILSEIVLPPPLVPHIDNFTCRNFKDWSEPVGEIIPERFREPRILTVTEALNDKICINNLSPANRTLTDQKSISSCEFFPSNLRTKFVSDGIPPTEITLEEIDYNNGFCTDYSLYNSFNSEHSTSEHNSYKISNSEHNSHKNLNIIHNSCKISNSEHNSYNISNCEHMSYKIPSIEHNSYKISSSEHKSYKMSSIEHNSYKMSSIEDITSEHISYKLNNIINVLDRQQ